MHSTATAKSHAGGLGRRSQGQLLPMRRRGPRPRPAPACPSLLTCPGVLRPPVCRVGEMLMFTLLRRQRVCVCVWCAEPQDECSSVSQVRGSLGFAVADCGPAA